MDRSANHRSLSGIALSVAALSSALAGVSTGAHAQTIGTDRPDFVESSSTVGRGNIQVEGSVAFDHTEMFGTEVDNWTTPFLFRVGIADSWELRLESDWLVSSRLDDDTPGGLNRTTTGVSDVAFGVKWAFLKSKGAGPAMAALVHADLPSGSDDFRGRGTRPSLRIVAEWALEGDWGIGIMPGVVYDRDDDGRFAAGILGAVVGKGITERTRAFVEIAFEQLAEDEHGGNVGFVDFGGTFLLNDRWQLDAAAVVGVTDRAPDLGFTLGLSGLFVR